MNEGEEVCGEVIETPYLNFECERKAGHPGLHLSYMEADDGRTISIYWPYLPGEEPVSFDEEGE